MKRIPRLQVITDETVQTRFSHAQLAQLALAGGVDAIQFREKRPRTAQQLIEVARDVLAACREHDAVLVIDDRADVALSVGAPAVHLGRNDLDLATARAILGREAVIGGTANSYQEAMRVAGAGSEGGTAGGGEGGIDYLGVGPIYGTRSKANPAPVMGLETLARICADAPVPVVAIGSITPERIPEVMACGAHGVAVLSAVVAAADPAEEARRCREALDGCLEGAQR